MHVNLTTKVLPRKLKFFPERRFPKISFLEKPNVPEISHLAVALRTNGADNRDRRIVAEALGRQLENRLPVGSQVFSEALGDSVVLGGSAPRGNIRRVRRGLIEVIKNPKSENMEEAFYEIKKRDEALRESGSLPDIVREFLASGMGKYPPTTNLHQYTGWERGGQDIAIGAVGKNVRRHVAALHASLRVKDGQDGGSRQKGYLGDRDIRPKIHGEFQLQMSSKFPQLDQVCLGYNFPGSEFGIGGKRWEALDTLTKALGGRSVAYITAMDSREHWSYLTSKVCSVFPWVESAKAILFSESRGSILAFVGAVLPGMGSHFQRQLKRSMADVTEHAKIPRVFSAVSRQCETSLAQIWDCDQSLAKCFAVAALENDSKIHDHKKWPVNLQMFQEFCAKLPKDPDFLISRNAIVS